MEKTHAAGIDIPLVGLGTASLTGTECRSVVSTAIDIGYRLVDSAQMYDNEDAVGAALEAADIDRDEMFLTTKLMRDHLEHDRVFRSFENSLSRFGVEYLDLLLIHAPNPHVPIGETISAMNDLQDDDLVRHIGVSNFSVDQLRDAVQASDRPIVTNQVKYNPYYHQTDLLSYCADRDVILTAYTPLDKGRVASDATLESIGARHGKTGAQVALRWLVQQPNVIAIPKASSITHLAENLDIFDFELRTEEMKQIFEIEGRFSNRIRSILDL